MGWRDWLALPSEVTYIARSVRMLMGAAAENTHSIKRMEGLMADVSQLLNDVADGLRGPLASSITELISERDALAAENAQLKGEDAAESSAAANVKAAFDEVAGRFNSEPSVPDVPELPTSGDDTGGSVDDGSTGDGATDEPAGPVVVDDGSGEQQA